MDIVFLLRKCANRKSAHHLFAMAANEIERLQNDYNTEVSRLGRDLEESQREAERLRAALVIIADSGPQNFDAVLLRTIAQRAIDEQSTRTE